LLPAATLERNLLGWNHKLALLKQQARNKRKKSTYRIRLLKTFILAMRAQMLCFYIWFLMSEKVLYDPSKAQITGNSITRNNCHKRC
jgi:hypothetical protein